jgi:hypothetical protein
MGVSTAYSSTESGGFAPLGSRREITQRKLSKWSIQNGSAALMGDNHRVAQCHHSLKNGKFVQVYKMPGAEGHTFFAGLMTCGSVWVCPICAPKITERRREELEAANRYHLSTGGGIEMLALTVPHRKGEPLALVLAKYQKARRHLLNSRGFKAIMGRCGVLGSVTALETTYGDNGWHPHGHALLYREAGNIETLDAVEMLPLWQTSCLKAGLRVPNEHGVNVKPAKDAESYVAKWGASCEMTKSHLKTGKKDSASPWDLLRDYVETGSETSGRLFKEYGDAFHGKRQLVWSRGMRKLLHLGEEKTDEEVAEEIKEQADLVITISNRDWYAIVANDLRGEVLQAAQLHGAEGVNHLLYSLRGDP